MNLVSEFRKVSAAALVTALVLQSFPVEAHDKRSIDWCKQNLTNFSICEKEGVFAGLDPEVISAIKELAEKNQEMANKIAEAKAKAEAERAKNIFFADSNWGVLNTERCPDDSLDRAQALGRNQWAINKLSHKLTAEAISKMNEYASRARPVYPSFARKTPSGALETVVMPTDPNADGSAFVDGMVVRGFCTSGCYVGSQLVRFSDDWAPIGQASVWDEVEQRNFMLHPGVLTLNRNSTLTEPSLNIVKVADFVRTNRIATEPVVEVVTEKGRSLIVTLDHPVMTISGAFKRAGELEVGDVLAALLEVPSTTIEGDAVKSISQSDYVGRVYNIDVHSDYLAENVIVAGGILNGTLYLQNLENQTLNRLIFRSNLTAELQSIREAVQQ